MGPERERHMDVVMPFVKNPETDADVNRVIAALGDIKADGRVITHDFCEGILRAGRDTSHYKTVLRHVRERIEHERGLWLDGRGLKGRGWLVLTPPEQVSRGHRGTRQKLRAVKRDVGRMSMPLNEEIPEAMRMFRAGYVASMSRVLTAAEQAQKEHRSLPKPVQSLPFRGTEGKSA
jgi:hypothetical protein